MMATATEIESLRSLRDTLASYIKADERSTLTYTQGRNQGYSTALASLDTMAALYGWWPVDGSVES